MSPGGKQVESLVKNSEEGRQHACTTYWLKSASWMTCGFQWVHNLADHVFTHDITVNFSITESCFLDTTPTIYWVMINNAVSIASKWTQKSSNIKNMLCHPNTVYGIIMIYLEHKWFLDMDIDQYESCYEIVALCKWGPYRVPICRYHGPSQLHPVGLKRSDLWLFVMIGGSFEVKCQDSCHRA